MRSSKEFFALPVTEKVGSQGIQPKTRFKEKDMKAHTCGLNLLLVMLGDAWLIVVLVRW